jgi:hypothetical protein
VQLQYYTTWRNASFTLQVGVFGKVEQFQRGHGPWLLITYPKTPLARPGYPSFFLQVGVFGKVEQFQRELDRIASLLDSDDEEAMGELVHGEHLRLVGVVGFLFGGCSRACWTAAMRKQWARNGAR